MDRRGVAWLFVLCTLAGGGEEASATSVFQSEGPRPRLPGVVPQAVWQTRTPAQVGLNEQVLQEVRNHLGGSGALVRHGYLVTTWGDASVRGDVASAGKPLYAHFLFQAVETGRLSSVDALASAHGASCLTNLNRSLGYKDRKITFRHMANQMSCYGVKEAPGQAFAYSDYQMALFWDTLFLGVWGTTYAAADAQVLVPELSAILGFQDAPTLMAFGTGSRPGRLAISPRDFCRFGLLYLRRGDWGGMRVLSEERAVDAVTRTLPLELPRTEGEEADMCPGQRTLGSTAIPDDQYAHDGGYAWSWWVNGKSAGGGRRWPGAESNVYAALGHGGNEGLAVLPCLDIVLSWKDGSATGLGPALGKLYQAASAVPGDPPPAVGPVLKMGKIDGGTLRLDWSEDEGAAGRVGEHYHVLRGRAPRALDLVPGTHPMTATQHDEAAAGDALVFYRVLAASACEQVSED